MACSSAATASTPGAATWTSSSGTSRSWSSCWRWWGGAGRPHPRAPRDLALVRPVRRARHPRHPPLPGRLGLDAPLHGERRGRGVRARLPRPVVHPGRSPAPGLIAPPGARVLLLDVEGTTTDVSFVHEVLFP